MIKILFIFFNASRYQDGVDTWDNEIYYDFLKSSCINNSKLFTVLQRKFEAYFCLELG